MKFIKSILLIFAISIISFIGFAEDSKLQSNLYEQQIKKLLDSLRDVTGVPAYSVAVSHQGKLVASVASGYVDIENAQKATPSHLFRLASVSKIIGATMLGDLVNDGRLDPDAPLGSIYPELNAKYHKMTVRQLMAHTSGMPHYQAKDYDIYSKHYTSAMEAVETLKGRSLLTEPGGQYHYSTHGYTLAGAIYEKVTGKPLSKSLPEYIRMFTGRVTPLIEDVTNLNQMSSRLYERSGPSHHRENFGEKSYSVFGAGLSATAEDLALFGGAVLKKSQQSDTYRDLLFTPVKTLNGNKTGNYLAEVGFGWRVGQDDQSRAVYHHAGATPGARSVIVLYPEEELSISFLSNASWVSSIERTAFAIADIYIKKAKSKNLSAKSYRASFGNSSTSDFAGKLDCKARKCFLLDDGSKFSKWLNRFNATGNEITAWPVYAYSSAQGEQMILVGKTGFINLSIQGKRFVAPMGKSHQISFRLNSK